MRSPLPRSPSRGGASCHNLSIWERRRHSTPKPSASSSKPPVPPKRVPRLPDPSSSLWPSLPAFPIALLHRQPWCLIPQLFLHRRVCPSWFLAKRLDSRLSDSLAGAPRKRGARRAGWGGREISREVVSPSFSAGMFFLRAWCSCLLITQNSEATSSGRLS